MRKNSDGNLLVLLEPWRTEKKRMEVFQRIIDKELDFI